MKTIVVIPTYNESDSIENIIRKVFEILPDIKILIVDDNSPDGTAKIVETLMKSFVNLSIMKREGKQGLGKAYISAFKEILKDKEVSTIITMDADMSHDPVYIPILLEKREKYDVVTGSRYIKGGGVEGWEMWRKLLSIGGNFYTKIITRMPIYDLTAGFNAISTDYLRKIYLDGINNSGYAFLIELKYLLNKNGAKMIEIPIIFKNRIMGESKISNHIITEGLFAPWRLIFNRIVTSKKCVVCLESLHTEYLKKNGHTLYRCLNCKMFSVHPLPSDIKKVYSEDYFTGALNGFGYVDYDTDKEPMRKVFVNYVKRINEVTNASLNKKSAKKYLLDIGAATGFFIDIARSAGFKVSGVEISSTAAKIAESKGLKVFNGTLEEFSPKTVKYNVITMLDVIEHVEDPRRLLVKAAEILEKKGIIVINTPDSGSLYARVLNKKWHLIVPPEHIYYFNRNSITKLLNETGFDVIVSTTIGKSFTLEYVFLMLGKWLKLRILFSAVIYLKNHPRIGHISIPINLGDNMFIIAKLKNK
jgi:dolichol-phosphate mannosyltransferase